MIQAIFFDFNGVIIDDESIQMKAYQQVLRESEIELTKEWYFDALGMDDKTFVRAMFERANRLLSEEDFEKVLGAKTELHRKMIEYELPLFPGVLNFLKSSARHFSLGLVSMANSVEIEYVFERAKLNPLFRVIITSEDVTRCKPAPDCYAEGLARMNAFRQNKRLLPLLPEECLAIEDSPPGIRAAADVGMKTLGVTNTVTESELRAAGADVVTYGLADWTVDSVKLVFDRH